MIRPIKVRKMKPYRYIIFLLVFVCTHGIQAQNLRQAEKDFDAGNFEKALQTFKVLVKKSPSNPSYNYYYGACCYETGNVVEAIPYLEKSAKRNYINAFRYLGKAYYDQYRFDEAVDCYEQHISLAEDKKRNTEAAEAELSQVHKAALMYKSVEDVDCIFPFVVHSVAPFCITALSVRLLSKLIIQLRRQNVNRKSRGKQKRAFAVNAL